MSILLLAVTILGLTGLGYAFFLMLRFFEMPDMLKMQYHYWREEMRERLGE